MHISKAKSRYRLGRMCELTILRIVSIGAYLEWADEDGILLPTRYLPVEARPGDVVRVFVYHDNEGRLIATTLQPSAQVGEIALLRCVSVNQVGAFLDWGIHKDLFVPFAEQQNKMLVGHSYLVYLYIDHISGKIVGSARLSKHIGNSLPTYNPGDEVTIIIAERNDVGLRAIVDHQHWGILYFDTLTEDIKRGEQLTAYVVRTREDGRLDLSLRPIGYLRTDKDTARLIELLHKHGGVLAIGDKSPAEEIMRLTGLSKKSFKMAIGRLYKEQRITLSPYTIRLT